MCSAIDTNLYLPRRSMHSTNKWNDIVGVRRLNKDIIVVKVGGQKAVLCGSFDACEFSSLVVVGVCWLLDVIQVHLLVIILLQNAS